MHGSVFDVISSFPRYATTKLCWLRLRACVKETLVTPLRASNSVCLTCELHNHDCKRNHDDRRPPPFRRRVAAASAIVGADADIAAIVTYQIKTGKRRHRLYSTPLQNYPHGDAKLFSYGSGETAV